MRFRRVFVPGGAYFFTLVTENRRPIFTSAETVEVLREAFRKVRHKLPFEIDAISVMPEHLHCIWTLPLGDADFSTRWRLLKTWFTKHCDPALLTAPNASRQSKNEQAIWQHRYWEHLLRDETDYERHVDYIHYNPVKHGLVESPIDWPYSSFRRYVEAGIYPPNWGGCIMNLDGIGHE